MARQIVEKHGFNEQKTAKLLGLSQSAISRYLSKERGNLLAIEGSTEILALIDQMVISLIKEPNNRSGIFALFCQTCRAIREKGLMCPLCQKEMPQEWAETCLFCRWIRRLRFIKNGVHLFFEEILLSYDENAILDIIEKASKSAVNISTVKLVHNLFYQAVPIRGMALVPLSIPKG